MTKHFENDNLDFLSQRVQTVQEHDARFKIQVYKETFTDKTKKNEKPQVMLTFKRTVIFRNFRRQKRID